MSSIYRIICLSHDPAIVTDLEWDSGVNGLAAAEHAAKAAPGHERCDVLIGRYSYPLVEVGCPCSKHRDVLWVDSGWLRLLALSQDAPKGTPLREAAENAPMVWCWSPARLRLLRDELGLEGA